MGVANGWLVTPPAGGTQEKWIDGYPAVIGGTTAGTISITNNTNGSGYNYVATSYNVSTAGYTISNSQAAASTDTFTGPMTLSLGTSSAVLNIVPNATLGGNLYLSSVSGTGTLNVIGAQNGGNSHVNGLQFANGANVSVPITINNPATLSAAGYVSIFGGSNNEGYTISGGITNSSLYSTMLWSGTPLGSVTVNTNPITGSSPLYLESGVNGAGSGKGTINLNVTNTYTGSTFILGGSNAVHIFCGATNALGTGGNNDLSWPVAGDGGILDMGGFSQTIGSLIGAVANAAITNNGGSNATLTIAQHSATNFADPIVKGTHDIAVVVNGTSGGNLTFNGSASTFTAGLTIEGGSTVTLNSTTATTNVLSGTNALTLGGGGNSGTLVFGASAVAQTFATLNLQANSTITLVNTGAQTLTFTSGSNGQTWNGSAVLTINGWTGSEGTTGSSDHIFVGTASNLTSPQLANIAFTGYPQGAVLILTGGQYELVPAVSANLTASVSVAPSTGSEGAGTTYTITVTCSGNATYDSYVDYTIVLTPTFNASIPATSSAARFVGSQSLTGTIKVPAGSSTGQNNDGSYNTYVYQRL